jgi:hypothetical protein
MEINQVKADENLKQLKEDIKTNQVKTDVNLKEMRSIVNSWTADMKYGRNGMMACQEKTEARLDCKEPTREEMESELEQEVPKEDAVVKPVKGQKKRHRGRKLAKERRGEPKELTPGICRSWRKLAAACRKVSRHARMAWRKGNVFRKILTQGYYGSRKELAADRKMTCRAGVARHKGNFIRKY